jgi:hypothetical protein
MDAADTPSSRAPSCQKSVMKRGNMWLNVITSFGSRAVSIRIPSPHYIILQPANGAMCARARWGS